MDGVVDADTHVVEHEAMWENFDDGGKMYPYRPLLIKLPPDTSWGRRNAFWLIDGEMFPKSVGRGAYNSHSPSMSIMETERTDISLGARQLTDVADRLRDMDKRGVEVQVIYSTLFIRVGILNAELEIACCHAYNRFMAAACKESSGRLRFVMVPPLHSIDASIAEMNLAKDQGAVGVHFRPVEANRTLGDPYFFPIYEEASRLNLPICVHSGGARFPADGPGLSGGGGAPGAFNAIVTTRLPERFPELKFGLIEFGSMWVPQTMHSIRRSSNARYEGPIPRAERGARSDAQLFKDYRIYVACFTDDDLAWTLNYTGEDNLIIGSDYSHQDPAEEMQFVEEMRCREDVAGEVVEKILCENPRNFYPL